MRKNKAYFMIFPSIILIFLFVFTLCLAMVKAKERRIFRTERDTKYTLYIGTSYGENCENHFTLDEAKKIMNDINIKYVDGCTIYEANGFWRDGENFISEKTLVCIYEDTEPKIIKNIMDEALKALKQSSILLETESIRKAFYTGEKN